MTSHSPRFAHLRLHAYEAALELFAGVENLARGMPRGYADLKDQLRRAAAATVRNIAEGANRSSPREKAARFIVARGEVGECDAALDMARVVGLFPPERIAELRRIADRVSAMLRGLIVRERRRAGD